MPFVGAGLSTPQCALWEEFVINLEREAEIWVETPSKCERCKAPLSPTELIRRAAQAVQKLRLKQVPLADVVRRALKSSAASSEGATMQADVLASMQRPSGSEALARIWWPLVITTN